MLYHFLLFLIFPIAINPTIVTHDKNKLRELLIEEILKDSAQQSLAVNPLLPISRQSSGWYCGSNVVQISQFAAEAVVRIRCPSLYSEFSGKIMFLDGINSACEKHDNCYGNKSGQAFCDDQFCAELNALHTGSWLFRCPYLNIFCLLVRLFGHLAYNG